VLRMQCVPLKCWYLPTSPHDVNPRKINVIKRR
jgi:hypothetical protein